MYNLYVIIFYFYFLYVDKSTFISFERYCRKVQEEAKTLDDRRRSSGPLTLITNKTAGMKGSLGEIRNIIEDTQAAWSTMFNQKAHARRVRSLPHINASQMNKESPHFEYHIRRWRLYGNSISTRRCPSHDIVDCYLYIRRVSIVLQTSCYMMLSMRWK